MAQSQDSHHVSVNAPDDASGSPINNKDAAMIPAKTRKTMRVSRFLAADEELICLSCLTKKLSGLPCLVPVNSDSWITAYMIPLAFVLSGKSR
jgi:hypothetical protein